MFNSTHTLVGIALARTGLDRWAPRATWTAVLASNLPDIDIVTQFAGTATYLDYHRGITHTLIGIPILSFLLAVAMYKITRQQEAETLWKHFAVAVIAMATHPILDWTNTYGVRPFLPFSRHWYYGDALFIIDPYLDSILLAGVIVSATASRKKALIAGVTLMIAVIYGGLALELRNIAQTQLALYKTSMQGITGSSVGPEFLNPFEWTGFLETATDVSSVRINPLTGLIQKQNRMEKALPSPVTTAADSTYSASVFHGFARYPVTRIERNAAGYRVLFIDFRFFRATAQTALSAEILLDNNLRVLKESLSFVRPID